MRSATVADRFGDEAEAVVDGPGDLFPAAGVSFGDPLGAFVGVAFPLVGGGEEVVGLFDVLLEVVRRDGVFVTGHAPRVGADLRRVDCGVVL